MIRDNSSYHQIIFFIFRLAYHAKPIKAKSGGPDQDRTDDLLNANQALSQLSYGPVVGKNGGPGKTRTCDPTLIKRVL